MALAVKLSIHFSNRYDGLPDRDLDHIDAFWDHCEKHGLGGWKGKVKPSWIVPSHYPDREARVAHAKSNNLWHAHIGIPTWKPSKNTDASYQVSDWVLHFQYNPSENWIKLCDYGDHDPFDLPDGTRLTEEL
ncbi:hypothetical protein [Pseudomonas syringae]|uniref:Uncharacterized protein n=1 Tax=Pseudomonas syringae pv. papulans TaxID=83963 RepID=A0A0P9X8A0_PSESX|nr:hypothetical protein [Pseudomonas syringae]KPY30478.1 hypothetical protein ALO65_101810 [Pseudomonas syringae pv. papulans]MDH4605694.1 hypothetical protein [Pseudomonas syringae pv. papulans]MDH4624188.1 hypothetical protein [Pseudomonas syringae pv. papulans]RMN47805.1 hypothetical protein ALQ60_00620 [Pseudomonas syringae pv. papulans]RMN74815.1 hypothetical protein ALQ56_04016 [Pseudomonas syringae pv. papulans]